MKSSLLKLSLVILVISVCCSVVYFKSSQTTEQTQTNISIQQDSRVALIAGYKKWTLVNPKPVKMDERVAILCDLQATKQGPHEHKFISVYVNNIGKIEMLEKVEPKYPVGTIIVKEKLDKENGRSPELLTVMIKREKGFDSENGDWEFMAFDGAATQEQKIEVKSCQKCHAHYEYKDFVVRNYLPDSAWKKMK